MVNSFFDNYEKSAAGIEPCNIYNLVMSTISKRKDKRFDIEAYYRNESKTFWYGLLIIGTKAKFFDLVQNFCYCKQIVFILAYKFWDEAKHFDLIWKLSWSKQNILIWSAYYQNENKTFWFGPLIIGTKAKQFDFLWKLSQRKRLHALVTWKHLIDILTAHSDNRLNS